jgi:outer membrane protein assembly factor BamB
MTIKDKIQLSQNIAILTGIFCVVVASLLLLNYWQISKNDPVESQVIEALVARLRQEPNNKELIGEIRNFDLLARKAYFTSQWQIKTGAFMLLAGSVVLVIALTVYYSLKSKIEEPDKYTENEIAGRILAQKWVIAIGVVVFGLAFLASFSSANYLERYHVEASVTEPQEVDMADRIEIIDVGEIQENASATQDDLLDQENSVSETASTAEVIKEEKPVAEPEETAVSSTSPGLTIEQIQRNHNSFRGPLGQGIIFHKNIPPRMGW